MGTLHGGMVATLIDTCTSALVFTKPPYHPGVSIDMSIRYLFYTSVTIVINMGFNLSNVLPRSLVFVIIYLTQR